MTERLLGLAVQLSSVATALLGMAVGFCSVTFWIVEFCCGILGLLGVTVGLLGVALTEGLLCV